jgi:mannose-1-phosphate guanylyltransferase
VGEFVVNTHHIPEAYNHAFPTGEYRNTPIHFRNESPVRLETAGGIANVRDLLDGKESFIVYNGDILTDLPLAPLMQAHCAQDNIVTLVLRSRGPALHIGIDAERGIVTDIRNKLGTGNEGTHLFTGIYMVSPRFFEWLTPGKVESVIPIFLRLIADGHRVGATVIDDGQWWDLGSRDAYIEAHRANLGETSFGTMIDVHSKAIVSDQATLRGTNIIGPGAVVAAGARVEDCILWPEAIVAPGAQLRRCIVRSKIVANGVHENCDF